MTTRMRRGIVRAVVAAAFIFPTLAIADDDDDDRRGPPPSRLLQQLTQFNGGCPPHPVDEPGGCIDVQFAVHRNHPNCVGNPSETLGDVSFTEVRNFDGSLVGGSSTLVRSADGLSYDLITGELAPDAPYTNWWVAFQADNPCLATCDCEGIDLRPGQDSVFWATGALSDILGQAVFAANVDFGAVPDGKDQTPFPAFANGIEPGAEIHIVVRAHGPGLPGRSGKGEADD